MSKNENAKAMDEEFISYVVASADMKLGILSYSTTRYIMRAVLAGVIIIFGYLIYVAAIANFVDDPAGKLFGSVFFSLCLLTIYYTKSELLTSNMMMTTVARYFGRITTKDMLKVLALCLFGNFLGGLIVGFLIGMSDIITPEMAATLSETLHHKLVYFSQEAAVADLFIKAIFCNFFINLAMLMVYSGAVKSDFGKAIVIFFGVFIFMYLGLEHSVANTVFFTTAVFYNLFHPNMLTTDVNMLLMICQVAIVLVGNFIGGGIFIGAYFSFMNKDAKLQ
ncbi:MAG: formate/nitrite transporter family protein [Coprobacillaceae bacterium]